MSTTEPRRGLPRPLIAACVAIGALVAAWGGLSVVALTMRTTDTTSRTYAVAGPLEVATANGNVTIIGEDRDDVRVDARATWSLKRPEVELRRDGGRVTLDGGCGGFWGHVDALGCSIDLELRVPRDHAVTARTTSGDVRAFDLAGEVTLRASSGDVRAEHVGGRLEVASSSGDIAVVGFRGDAVAARASSGDVTVRAATPPRRTAAHANSGNVTIAVPDATYAVDVRTGSGDQNVAVRQSPDAARAIEASANSGDVTVVRLDDAR
jgi:DUF4097 and DUF4098 domain-containing protein YvlB